MDTQLGLTSVGVHKVFYCRPSQNVSGRRCCDVGLQTQVSTSQHSCTGTHVKVNLTLVSIHTARSFCGCRQKSLKT